MKKKIPLAYFLLLSVFSIILFLINYSYFEINQLMHDQISNQISLEFANQLREQAIKLKWLNYLIIPLLLLTKTIIFSSGVYIGLYFFDKKIGFKKLWAILLQAEFIFVIATLLKTLWFILLENNFTLKEFQYFFPLSALNIVGYEGVDPWFIYPLQVLNLFELAYWFMLAYLLGKELNISMDKGFKIVASSYGPALLIWVVAVMFFTLNYS